MKPEQPAYRRLAAAFSEIVRDLLDFSLPIGFKHVSVYRNSIAFVGYHGALEQPSTINSTSPSPNYRSLIATNVLQMILPDIGKRVGFYSI